MFGSAATWVWHHLCARWQDRLAAGVACTLQHGEGGGGSFNLLLSSCPWRGLLCFCGGWGGRWKSHLSLVYKSSMDPFSTWSYGRNLSLCFKVFYLTCTKGKHPVIFFFLLDEWYKVIYYLFTAVTVTFLNFFFSLLMMSKSNPPVCHENIVSRRHAGAESTDTSLWLQSSSFEIPFPFGGSWETPALSPDPPGSLTRVHLGFVAQSNWNDAAGLPPVGCNPHSSLFLIRPAFSEQTFPDPVSLTAEYLASNTIRCLMLTFPHPFALQPSETVMKLLFFLNSLFIGSSESELG